MLRFDELPIFYMQGIYCLAAGLGATRIIFALPFDVGLEEAW